MLTVPRDLTKAKTAKRETTHLEFKEQLDVGSERDWCEVIKDIVALANSGGGLLLIGLRNDGSASGSDVGDVLALDPATVTDKIFRFTGEHFSEFAIEALKRSGRTIAAVDIGPSKYPMIFEKECQYVDPISKKQKVAFARGTFYVRHGAKSEPATSSDLRSHIEKAIKADRRSLTKNMRRVVEAPIGSQVRVLAGEVRESASSTAVPIRVTDDPSAPAYRRVAIDDAYPYRQTELVAEVNRRLAGKSRVNGHDILCIRRMLGVDADENYCHRPRFSTPQYSAALVTRVLAEYDTDNAFFSTARLAFKAGKRG